MKQILILLLVMAGCLFGAAGTFRWWNAWLFLIAVVIVGLLTSDALKSNPGLTEERRAAMKTAKIFDKVLVPLISVLLPLLSLIVAGLDRRWGLTGALPQEVSAGAFGAMVGGSLLTFWAMKTNAYFSSVVRVQKDRGHQVITGGPYRMIRHPGYCGAILYNLAGPLLLGSLPALGVGVVIGCLLVVRTASEDKTLQDELDGYKDYAVRVRYRLVPFVW